MDYPLSYDRRLSSDEAFDRFMSHVQAKDLTLYAAQEEAILELFADKNVILNTPTGSGKSLVASALHFRSATSGQRSVYTSPIKALVNEKFLALCREFGPDRVGMMTGDAAINRDAPVLCVTAEILANIALRQGERALINDVVIDEFHFYSDRERGYAWQIPLLCLPQTRFLLMSATIGETDFFQAELTKLNKRQTAVVRSNERPVPLDFRYCETPLDQTIADLLSSGKAPIYVVSFTQAECAENAQNLMSTNFCSKEEKNAIAAAIADVQFLSPYGKEVKKYLRHGVGLHHAGLLPKYRILVESLAQKGLVKVICGTDTLGVGVNIPIRSVLFTKLCKFDGEKTGLLTARDFHQIAGRAGRRGFDAQGSIIAQAPEHVIENLKLAKKALLNPSKKFVKAKPPTKGFVMWTEETFTRLIDSPPERLQSRFKLTHGILLNVLGRTSNGCRAMKNLIRDCHESDVIKGRLRKRGIQLLRALLEKKIVEFIPVEDRELTPIRVTFALQDDFSLNQTLSLYFLDTLNKLDPFGEAYPLELLTLVESILENPEIILRRQLDRIKREKMEELRAAGLEFEERIAELDKLEYPKPMRDFIYDTFNTFAAKHPWVEEENIRPKSVAREMYETFQSFDEYIRNYDLHKSEGLLLRYISDTYKTLVQTVPDSLRNDAVDEMIVYFETMLKTTDSSLLDEWKKLRDPNYQPSERGTATEHDGKVKDITTDERQFAMFVRTTVFNVLRGLAARDYEKVLAILTPDPSEPWDEKKLDGIMETYCVEHQMLRTDGGARQSHNLHITKSPGKIAVECVFVDPEELNDWSMHLDVDVAASAERGEVVLHLRSIGPIGGTG